jgi:hypothetical protein
MCQGSANKTERTRLAWPHAGRNRECNFRLRKPGKPRRKGLPIGTLVGEQRAVYVAEATCSPAQGPAHFGGHREVREDFANGPVEDRVCDREQPREENAREGDASYFTQVGADIDPRNSMFDFVFVSRESKSSIASTVERGLKTLRSTQTRLSSSGGSRSSSLRVPER